MRRLLGVCAVGVHALAHLRDAQVVPAPDVDPARKPLLWYHVHKTGGTYWCRRAVASGERVVQPNQNCNAVSKAYADSEAFSKDWAVGALAPGKIVDAAFAPMDDVSFLGDAGDVASRPGCAARAAYWAEQGATYGQIEHEVWPEDECPQFRYGTTLRRPLDTMASEANFRKLDPAAVQRELEARIGGANPAAQLERPHFPTWLMFDNILVRYFAPAMDVPAGQLGPAHLEAALKRLKNFTVAVLECPQADVWAALGWPALDAQQDGAIKDEAAGQFRENTLEFSPDEARFLADLNRWDEQLYDHFRAARCQAAALVAVGPDGSLEQPGLAELEGELRGAADPRNACTGPSANIVPAGGDSCRFGDAFVLDKAQQTVLLLPNGQHTPPDLTGLFAMSKYFSHPPVRVAKRTDAQARGWAHAPTLAGTTMLAKSLFTENPGHALFDNLYPAFLSLLRTGAPPDADFRLLVQGDRSDACDVHRCHNQSSTTDYGADCSRKCDLMKQAFETFAGEPELYWEDLQPPVHFETLVVGSYLMGQLSRTKDQALFDGRAALPLFRDRMLARVHAKANPDGPKVIIIDNKRYTPQEKGMLQQLAADLAARGTPAEYVRWSAVEGIQAQLSLVQTSRVYVSGPGTGIMYAPFLKDGSVVVNLGGVLVKNYALPNGTELHCAAPTYMETNLVNGAPFVRTLYYPSAGRVDGLEPAALRALVDQAEKLVDSFAVPVPAGANLNAEGALLVEYCRRDATSCDQLVRELNSGTASGTAPGCDHDIFWSDLVVNEFGPWMTGGVREVRGDTIGNLMTCNVNRTLLSELRTRHGYKPDLRCTAAHACFNDLTYRGGDLGSPVAAQNAKDCQKQCAAHAECKHFTWLVGGSYAGCALKSGKAELEGARAECSKENTGGATTCVSGPKTCPRAVK